jgi:hypothetical protein
MAVTRALALGLLTVAASLVSCTSTGAASPAPHSPPTPGYWLVGADGGVFAFNAPFEGSGAPGAGSPGLCAFAFGPGIDINAQSLANADGVLSRVNCVGIAGSEGSAGYWVADFASLPSAFGSASALGQLSCTSLNGAAVGWSGMAATPSGRGFFLTSVNGGVLGCGDATPLGGVTKLHLAAPIVGIAATPDGKGYWLVGSDGGVFAFGDAGFHGSMGGKALNAPIVGIAATPDGKGYWLVGSDGGVFAFGDATFCGSMGGHALNQPVTGMAANPDGSGYWLVAADGGIFAFGGAPFEGSMSGTRLNAPIVGMAAAPN